MSERATRGDATGQPYREEVETRKEEAMTPDRKEILLRAAYDLLKRSQEGPCFEEATAIQVRYDEADCSGFCLMEDIMFELDLDDGTEPIPLEGNEDDDT
jgi:hypothetical protein